jgi:hypothetical protein
MQDRPSKPNESTAHRFLRLQADFVAAFAYLFSGTSARPALTEPARRSWPIVPIGLLIGLIWVGTFRGSWRIFGDMGGLRLLPALAIIGFDVLVLSRCLFLALTNWASVERDEDSPNPSEPIAAWPAMVVVIALVSEFTLVLSLPHLQGWWPSSHDWRSWFNWMYPYPLYRPLLLAPIWGRWGILVALCMGRAAADADPLTRSYVGSMRPIHLFGHSILPVALTTIYCSRGGNFVTGPMIAVIILAATVLFATIATHQRGGQTRTTALATGLVTQIVFLIVYRGFWRLIE